jgi:hypothetical protein
MNQRARGLGLSDTRFRSPNGLDDAGYSTAHDLAVITLEAFRHDLFGEVAGARFRSIPAPEGCELQAVPDKPVYGAVLFSQRVRNWERGQPDNRATTRKNVARRLEDFRPRRAASAAVDAGAAAGDRLSLISLPHRISPAPAPGRFFMRKISWLLLVLAGCAGSDGNPDRVAERFHARLAEGSYAGAHALLTEADRAAFPLAAFPDALPAGAMLTLFAWGDRRLDAATLLRADGDSAVVALRFASGEPDTLRLVATHELRRPSVLGLSRVRWRVSIGLAERALLDSLAAAMRTDAGPGDVTTLEAAEAYLHAAAKYPGLVRPGDLAEARSTVRRAGIAETLGVELRVARSPTGGAVIEGRVENPTGTNIRALRLIVQDAAGAEQRLELWDVPAGGSAPVWQATRLRSEPLTYRVVQVRIF